MIVLASQAVATVVDFDDIASGTDLVGSYAGITWGTSTSQSYNSNTGNFTTYGDASYANAASGPNFVYNGWGAQDLSFTFEGGPVTFTGASFAAPIPDLIWGKATQIRFHDDLGNYSAWLNVTTTPTFLTAGFVGSTTVFVEYNGTGPQQYTMDDVTFEAVPEPASMFALGAGVLAIARRRRQS